LPMPIQKHFGRLAGEVLEKANDEGVGEFMDLEELGLFEVCCFKPSMSPRGVCSHSHLRVNPRRAWLGKP
jgi:hypothetical protein